MSIHWENKNFYNYKKIRCTKFEKAVAHYICKILDISPNKPVMSITGSWYYRQWEVLVIHGSVKNFVEFFKDEGFDFSGDML